MQTDWKIDMAMVGSMGDPLHNVMHSVGTDSVMGWNTGMLHRYTHVLNGCSVFPSYKCAELVLQEGEPLLYKTGCPHSMQRSLFACSISKMLCWTVSWNVTTPSKLYPLQVRIILYNMGERIMSYAPEWRVINFVSSFPIGNILERK